MFPKSEIARVSWRRTRGFTLMEVVIVLTVIAILATVALPVFVQHIRRAKEVTLQKNLYEMRSAIDKYTLDKERAPQSLEDLVSAGYLKFIPVDPITKSADTWQTEIESEPPSPDVPAGIANVRSGAEGAGSDGVPYSQY
jgi:general secretion pathway protein G